MQDKDNVYEKESAEEVATANTVNEKERTENTEETLTALGKFKDVNALAKAYGCLQAEFTRRSQKLKQLEKQVENFQAEQAENTAKTGVEKLRQNAAARKAEEEKFDDFISEVERANVRALSLPEETQPKETDFVMTVEKNSVEAKEQQANDGAPIMGENVEIRLTEDDSVAKDGWKNRVPTGTQKQTSGDFFAVEPSQEKVALSSDELYERVKADESVRLKLIGEYLSSIGKSGAPLLCGGAGALATPPQKAKSIHEAGNMALLMFKNGGVQA